MKIRSPRLLNLGGWLIAKFVRLLFSTLTIEAQVALPASDPRYSNSDRCYLYCFWHEFVLMPIALSRVKNMSGLVSRHQDGGLLAMTMKHLRIRAVRGSSSKGGTRALRELLTAAEQWHIAITPDGPRGPRREIKNGIVYLASQSGNPIVPVSFAWENAWVLRGNWTDLVIPKPFSKLHVFTALPITVPGNLDRHGIEVFRDRLQQEMDRLDERAELVLTGSERSPDLKRAA